MRSSLVFFISILTFTNFSQAQQVEWKKMFLNDAMGVWDESSELADPGNDDDGIGKYCACWLFDNDVTTAWVEGVKGDGIGEYVLIGQKKNLPDKIHINNGYQKSESLYLKNGRPKSLGISLYVAYHLPADVTELGDSLFEEDFGERQTEMLKNSGGYKQYEPFFGYVFKLEILDVYKGSRWDDICISCKSPGYRG